MGAEVFRAKKSPRKRCPATFTLAEDVVLPCKERDGHEGQHFGDVTINGIPCETGWRDGDPGAALTPETAEQSNQEVDHVVPEVLPEETT